jgi:ABC-type glycerol-3-phosphate transport system permease component
LVAAATTIITLTIGSLAAYAVTHWGFRGSRTFLGGTVFTQLLPQAAVLIPIFLLWGKLHIAGSLEGLSVVYVGFALPVGVWMLTSYFDSLPRELTEAARVDGSSHIGALTRVLLPAARPGLAAVAIFTFLASWSELLFALTLISDPKKNTITVQLAELVGEHTSDTGVLLAGATLASVPVVALFLLFQRYFVSGLTVGAVKH